MSIQQRILKRKIKKREARKLELLKQKRIIATSDSEEEDIGIQLAKEKRLLTPRTIPRKSVKGVWNVSEVTDKEELRDPCIDKQIHLGKRDDKSSRHFEIGIKNDLEDDEAREDTDGAVTKIHHKSLDSTKFSSLTGKVSDATLRALKEMGFTTMTDIQAKAIPILLEGNDLLAVAKTGSGKTLAFLIPAVELIMKIGFRARNGAGCIILSPTRELCLQTYGVLQQLMKYQRNTYGLIMGKSNKVIEAKLLSNGLNIIVATPGRLLDHMQTTEYFLTKNLMCLIIDEADRILEVGFEEEIKQIINILPRRRQTMLFSATLSSKTETLKQLVFRHDPLTVGLHETQNIATVEGLYQGYLICPSQKRLLLLFSILKKTKHKKVMVFFSSGTSVKFHDTLFNYIDLPVLSIYGKQEQAQRTVTFFKFSNAEKGILLCTNVAARGLDIPAVDWIIQYDPPDDPKDYIHRVGRTARGKDGKGQAILILRPEELGFLHYLQQAKVPLNEFSVDWRKAKNVQDQLEHVIQNNKYLHTMARDGFIGYIRAYESHHLKSAFNVEDLDLHNIAKSFGLRKAPAIV